MSDCKRKRTSINILVFGGGNWVTYRGTESINMQEVKETESGKEW